MTWVHCDQEMQLYRTGFDHGLIGGSRDILVLFFLIFISKICIKKNNKNENQKSHHVVIMQIIAM